MEETLVTIKPMTKGTFFNRNSRWLLPLLATLALLSATSLTWLLEINMQCAVPLPALPPVALGAATAVGLATAAVFAVSTRTRSAVLFLWGVIAAALTAFWYGVCWVVYTMMQG